MEQGGLVLISDTHFDNRTSFSDQLTDPEFPGCNNRFHETAKAFRWAVSVAKENSAKAIVVLGDIFHTRGVIQVPVYNAVYQLLKEVPSGIEAVLFPGNHDYADIRALGADKRLHSLTAFHGTEHNVWVVSRPFNLELYPFNLGIVPFTYKKEDTIAAVNTIPGKWRKNMTGGVNILMLHHSVHGAVTGPHEWKMTEELKEEEISGDFDLVFSGHYHKHQKVGKLTYVGAPLHHDMGEHDYKPGIIYVNPDGSWEHIKNTFSPRFKLIEAQTERDLPKNISKDYVTIRWKGDADEGYKVSEKYPKVRLEVLFEDVSAPARTSMETTDSVDTLLEKFVVHKKGKKDEKLLEVGKRIYEGK